MRVFFTFMISLLSVRVGYHFLVKIDNIAHFLELEDTGIYSLALLIPYVTEVIFNIVIFYFNFMMPDSGLGTAEEENPNNLVEIDQASDQDSEGVTKAVPTSNNLPTIVSGSVRTWFKTGRNSNPAYFDEASQGTPKLNSSRDHGKYQSKINNYHFNQHGSGAKDYSRDKIIQDTVNEDEELNG